MSVQYFLDDATMFEVEEIVNNIPFVDRNEREMQRYEMYILTQINSRKKIKPGDIMSFAWDSEQEEHDVEISNADIERLKAKAQLIQQIDTSNI